MEVDVTAFPYPATLASEWGIRVTHIIENMLATGGVVYFPAGSYPTYSPIRISAGVKVRGDGVGSTTIDYKGASGPAFEFVEESGPPYYSGISDIRIEGESKEGTTGILIYRGLKATIERVVIVGMGIGIDINRSTETTVTDCHLANLIGTSGIRVRGEPGALSYRVVINNLTCTTPKNSPSEVVWIDVREYANSISINKCALVRGGVGIKMSSAVDLDPAATTKERYDASPKWILGTGVEIDNSFRHGVVLESGEGFNITNSWIGQSGRPFAKANGDPEQHGTPLPPGDYGFGVRINEGYHGDVTLHSTRIRGAAKHGVYCKASGTITTSLGPQGVQIVDCIIGNNSGSYTGQDDSKRYHGIRFDGPVKNFRVQNCTLGTCLGEHNYPVPNGGNSATPTNRQGYDLFVGGLCTNYVVTGNRFIGSLVGTIYDGGSAPKLVGSNV